jgi:hypothetical protein
MKNDYLCSEIVEIDPSIKGEVPTLSHYIFWYIILIIGTMKSKKCCICKSEIRVFFRKEYGNYLCNNHKNHLNRNGYILKRTRCTPNPILVRENYAEIIIFNRRHEEKGRALIDIEDINLIKDKRWCIDGCGSVMNKQVGKLHRFVLNIKNPKGEIDHINRNLLDCRKNNLREISHSLNILNAKKFITNTSGRTGVRWSERRSKWLASIRINYREISLGAFKDINKAIEAREKAELDLIPIKIYPR